MTFVKETYYNVEIQNLFYTTRTLTPTDDSTISITSSYVVLQPSSPITLNATTSINDGTYQGQTVTLRGTSDTNTVTINNSSNTKMNGNIVLKNNDTISLVYNGVIWVETARNNSSLGQEGSTGHLVLDASGNVYSDGTGTAASLSGGANNIILGNDSGNAISTGNRNIFIGYQAGYKNTTSNGDIAIGYRALGYYGTYVSSGENVSIGDYSGSYLQEGVSNTFIGAWAGFNVDAGDYNTHVGYEAGTNSTGSYNLFLGYGAGANENGSNRLYISNSNTSNPLIYGEFDNYYLKINGYTEITNHIKIGDISGSTSNGIIRFNGTDFQGYYNGWKSLTNSGGTSVTNPQNNRVLISDGTSTGIKAYSGFTYNGTQTFISGDIRLDGTNDTTISLTSVTSSGKDLYIISSSGTSSGGDVRIKGGEAGTNTGGYVYISPGSSVSGLEGNLILGNNGTSTIGNTYIKNSLYIQNTTLSYNIKPNSNNLYNLGDGQGLTTTSAESYNVTMQSTGYTRLSQIFTTRGTWVLSSVQVKIMQEVGSWDGVVAAKLYSTTGFNGDPVTEIDTSLNSINVTDLEGFPEWHTFYFDDLTLTSNTSYAIVLETIGSSNFQITWYGADSVYDWGKGGRYDGTWHDLSTPTADLGLVINQLRNWKNLYVSNDVEFTGQVVSSINMTTTTGALKVSSLNDAQETALTPLDGMIIYNNTNHVFRGYINGSWTDFAASGTTSSTGGTSYWSLTPNTTDIGFANSVSIGKTSDPATTLDVNGTTTLGGNTSITGNLTFNLGASRTISVGGSSGYNLTIKPGPGTPTGGNLYLSAGLGSTTDGNVYIGYDGSNSYINKTYIYSDIELGGQSDRIIYPTTAGNGENGNAGYSLTIQSGEGFDDGANLNLFGGYGYSNGGDVFVSGGKEDTVGGLYEGDVILGQYGSGGVVVGNTYVKNDLYVEGASQFSGDITLNGNLRVTGQAWSSSSTLISSASITSNCDNGNVFILSLSHNAQLENPSNTKAGSTYLWIITNSGSYTLSFGSNFYFPNNSNSDIASGAGKISILTGVCAVNGGALYCNMIVDMV